MINLIIGLFIGLFLGVFFGILIMSFCYIAKKSDEDLKRMSKINKENIDS